MLEIKLTLDATPALIGAVRDLAGAIHSASNNARPVPAGAACDRLTTQAAPVDAIGGPEKDSAAENAQNLPSEAPAEAERTETPENVEEPKKRKSRAKKAPSESNDPVCPLPAIETPAHETDPAPSVVHLDGEDPLAGKGQTGEVLTELTRKAIAELDAAGVDRTEANRRIRDYCSRTDIKFPTFPALLQAVGYAEAIAICKGARV